MGLYDRDYTRADYNSPYDRASHMHIGFPRLTPVVKGLLIANIAVFLLVYVSGLINERLVDFWHLWFSVYPKAPFMYLQVWRLVTYQFLHADFGHILFNMIALCVFGPMLESVWGSRKFLVFYLICGAMGGIFYPILAWIGWLQMGILIGASGAILGALSAAAILFPNRRLYIWGIFPIRIMVLAIILAVISIATLLQPEHYPNAGGQAAHLAGMAAGAVYVFTESWRARIMRKLKSRMSTRRLKTERNLQAELDRILEKVHDSGIHSLSSREKRILKEATRLEQMRNNR